MISDSVSADEIGTLPDFNVAEALQRVPGISTDQDNGEDRFVVVRGFQPEYNFTTVDGLTLPSTDNASRAVLFDTIPSTLIDRVDVFKSFTADMDGQAIGGAINLVTRSAFRQRPGFFVANLSAGRMEYTDQGPDRIDPSYRANATYSTVFGAHDQFGLALAFNGERRDTYTLSPTNSGTARFYFYDGAGRQLTGQDTVEDVRRASFIVPENASMYLYHSDRERLGGMAKLEFRSPSSDLRAYLQSFYFRRTDDERRDHSRVRNLTGSVAPLNLTQTSGTVVGASEPVTDLVDQVFEDTTAAVQTGFDWRFGGRGRLVGRAGHSRAELDNSLINGLFNISSNVRAGFSYRLDETDGFMVLTPTQPDFMGTAANYRMFRTTIGRNTNTEEINEATLDYAWNADPADQGPGLMIGGKYRQFDRVKNNDSLEYRPRSPLSMAGLTLDHTWVPPVYTVPMLFIDTERLSALNFTDTSLFNLQSSSVTASNNADYEISEDVAAAYLMAVWNRPGWRATAGVRYEETRVEASALQLRSGVFSPIASDTRYSNWLPRASLTYDVTDALRLRLAYSRPVGRPDYGDLAPYRTVTLAPVDRLLTISGGNPDLKPRVSDNYDLSLEYYVPGLDGLLSVGLFRKDIQDEIFTLRTFEPGVTFEGLTVDVTTNTPTNADSASLTGLEVGVIFNRFDFLPEGPWRNFGAAVNWTYIDSDAVFGFVDDVNGDGVPENTSRSVPLFLQPEQIANASLFYRQGPFEGRLSVNFKGEHLKSINDADSPFTDRYYDDRTRVDATLRYALTDRIRLSVEGKNLTGSYAQEIFAFGGHSTERDSGREVWLGLSFRR